MFMRTASFHEYINSDDVMRLRSRQSHKYKDHYEVVAIMRDGTAVDLGLNDIDEVVQKTLPVVPAAPGYEALYSVEYEEEPRVAVIRHPVIGWRPDLYGGMHAVTYVDENAENVIYGGVKYPDGRVVSPCGDRYASEEEWFEERQREFEADAAKMLKVVK